MYTTTDGGRPIVLSETLATKESREFDLGQGGILQLCIDGVPQWLAGAPIPYVAGGEGEGENEDGDENDDDDGENDTDGGGDGNSDGSGSGSEGESGDHPLKKVADKERKLRKEAERKRRETEAELNKLKTKDLPELEQVKTELQAVTGERDTLRTTVREHALELAFLKADTGITWHDAGDALSAVRKELGELDDDEIDVEEIKQIAQSLAQRKPYLVKSDGKGKGKDDKQEPVTDGKPDGNTSGAKGKGGNNKDKQFSNEYLREQYSALRR